MSNSATINRRTMDQENIPPTEELDSYLKSLSPAQLRELASYARKMAAGMEDENRKPGSRGGRWLEAQYVYGSGPYFYLYTYYPADHSYVNKAGRTISGSTKQKYVGRYLPPDLAEEFDYPEGASPEDTDVRIVNKPGSKSSRKKSSE